MAQIQGAPRCTPPFAPPRQLNDLRFAGTREDRIRTGEIGVRGQFKTGDVGHAPVLSLPLIFHHEIGHLLGTEVGAPTMPAGTPRASLDSVMATAKARHPHLNGMFVSQEPDDDRVWFVTLSPTPTAESGLKRVAVDARTGEALAEPKLDEGFMQS